MSPRQHKPPRAFQSEGFVLRLQAFGEQDRYVTFLTRQHGKVTCVAKGIRNFKSRRSRHIELFSHVSIQLWKSTNNHYLTQAVANDRFDAIKSNLAAMTSATFMIEMTDRVTPDEEPQPELYDLLAETLDLMSFYVEHHALLRGAFVLKALQGIGTLTSFRNCAQCREKLPLETAWLDEAHLTLHCRSCTEKNEVVHRPIALDTLKLIHFILERPILAVLKLKMAPDHYQMVDQFGRLFLTQNLHYPLKSERFLEHY